MGYVLAIYVWEYHGSSREGPFYHIGSVISDDMSTSLFKKNPMAILLEIKWPKHLPIDCSHKGCDGSLAVNGMNWSSVKMSTAPTPWPKQAIRLVRADFSNIYLIWSSLETNQVVSVNKYCLNRQVAYAKVQQICSSEEYLISQGAILRASLILFPRTPNEETLRDPPTLTTIHVRSILHLTNYPSYLLYILDNPSFSQ
ncbi:hypothetical protein CR513_41757, partial [Mucuna pruriens]